MTREPRIKKRKRSHVLTFSWLNRGEERKSSKKRLRWPEEKWGKKRRRLRSSLKLNRYDTIKKSPTAYAGSGPQEKESVVIEKKKEHKRGETSLNSSKEKKERRRGGTHLILIEWGGGGGRCFPGRKREKEKTHAHYPLLVWERKSSKKIIETARWGRREEDGPSGSRNLIHTQ